MADRETAHYRGEAGVVIAMDLPLPEVMADKVIKGYLTRVNADGSPFVDAAQGEPEIEQPPSANMSKGHWVGYAHRVHGIPIDDAEALTKHDLMELYGSKA